MLQKEVAERICTGPGSKVYGILSVLLQAWYDCEYLFSVEPSVFAPPAESAQRRAPSHPQLAHLSRLRSGALPESGENRLRTASQNAPQLSRPAYTPRLASTPLGTYALRPERLSVDQFIELTNLIATKS